MSDHPAYGMPNERVPTGARARSEVRRSESADEAVVKRALAILEQESRAWTALQHRKHSR